MSCWANVKFQGIIPRLIWKRIFCTRWVISDSSVLIHLTRTGQLILLEKIFGRITITPIVWTEVVEGGGGRFGASEVSKARKEGWIDVVAPTNDALLRLLKRELDDGEAEAIALAVERQADLILLDEWEARRIADLTAWQRLSHWYPYSFKAVWLYSFIEGRTRQITRTGRILD